MRRRLPLLTFAALVALAACADNSRAQASWSGATEPMPLRAPWAATHGDRLVIEDVPFGGGSRYCVSTGTGYRDLNATSACTLVFWTRESLRPPSGVVTFLNATELGPGRALFVAVVTEFGVAVDMQCGTLETDTSSIAETDVSVVYGIADTSGCTHELAFDFSFDSMTQTVSTTATA